MVGGVQDASVSFEENREDAGEGASIYTEEHEQSGRRVEQPRQIR